MSELAVTVEAKPAEEAAHEAGTLEGLRRPRWILWATLIFAGSMIVAPGLHAKAMSGKAAVKSVAMLDHRRARPGDLPDAPVPDGDGDDGGSGR